MSHLAVGALQLELAAENNVDTLCHEIGLAMRRFPWLQMLVLPELAAHGPDTAHAEPVGGDTEQAFREAAREHGVWLVPGSFFERDDAGVHNTALVIDPDGEVVTRYRKQFPFLPYEQGVTAGDRFAVFDIPGAGRIGLLICYDMWFPETVRTLAWMGAEAVICPSLTNTIDRDVELAMARANAAVNQLYFLNLNTAGRLGVGRSIAVGPEGEVIHTAGSGRELIHFEMDFARVKRVRERGMYGACQVLKSFRDGPTAFPPYQPGAPASGALEALGPLRKPERD